MSNRVKQIGEQGQAIWLDFISRDLLESGELPKLINDGVTGMTSNPTIFQKSIATGHAYDDQWRELINAGRSVGEIYDALTVRDIQDAADQLRRVYDETSGRDGYVSLEVSPKLAHDTDGTLAEARRLFALVDRPNLMIKVPATEEGVPAVRKLIFEGINVNVTLIFAIGMYERVMEAYVGGLQDRREAGRTVGTVASVASFFVSRVDSAIDKLLDDQIAAGKSEVSTLRGHAAIANAKIAYDRFKHVVESEPFASLKKAGARVQRPLWASTSTKNPAYPATKYVDSLIGPDTVNTVPPQTLDAIREQASAARTIDLDVNDAYSLIEKLGTHGIKMCEVTCELLKAGVQSFADSFDELIAGLAAKKAAMQK